MIGDFLRNAGKHVANKTISKAGRGYAKANSKIKSKGFNLAKAAFKRKEKEERSNANVERKMQERLAKTTKRAKQDTKRTGLYVVRGRGGRG